MIALNEKEIIQKRKEIHSEWKIKENGLHREFEFENFVNAFSFMTSVAFISEKLGHHPNWNNQFNKVTINLFTYDCDAITHKDFDLAKAIDLING